MIRHQTPSTTTSTPSEQPQAQEQPRDMVSNLPNPSSAPPTVVPRASSVISTRSHTRRHRHPRSHHGASNHVSQNEFPVFSQTGDVEIIIRNAPGTKENRYLLHKLILSQCSGFFEAGTRAEWSAGRAIEQGPSAGNALSRISENESVVMGSASSVSSGQEPRLSYEQGRRHWRYELDWNAAGEHDIPILVQRDAGSCSIFGSDGPPAVRNKPPTSNDSFFRSISTFSSLDLSERNQPSQPAEPGDEVLKDYDGLFRCLYQYPPSLDTVNIATAYTECKALLHLADMYDALEIVGSRVDHHLLRFGARLFKQIAKYPPSYLKLGFLAKSQTIFTEALIHVVGQWPHTAPQLRGQLDANVMELLEDKVDELREMEERVESKLWRLNLTTSRGERVTPSNDYLGWLAVSLFRQWLAENTTPPPTGILKDTPRPGSGPTTQTGRGASGNRNADAVAPPRMQPGPAFNTGRVYRLIGSADATAYLPRDELKRFLKSPGGQLGVDLYSRDHLRRLERRVENLKNMARDTVKPLMRNFLELDLRDLGPAGLGYLTCTRLDGRDLPWDD